MCIARKYIYAKVTETYEEMVSVGENLSKIQAGGFSEFKAQIGMQVKLNSRGKMFLIINEHLMLMRYEYN